MFLIEILHNQWLLLGFGGGLLFMLSIVLIYTAGWHSREAVREKAEVPLDSLSNWVRWARAAFPWIIALTILGVAIWSILYPLYHSHVPPNW